MRPLTQHDLNALQGEVGGFGMEGDFNYVRMGIPAAVIRLEKLGQKLARTMKSIRMGRPTQFRKEPFSSTGDFSKE